MAHSVSEAAARAVKNSQRVKAEERTPEQILKGIRGNLDAKLAVTPSDIAFLLAGYDSLLTMVTAAAAAAAAALETTRSERNSLAQQVVDLQAQVDRFREVYEMENNVVTVTAPTIEVAVQTAQDIFSSPNNDTGAA